MSRTKSSKRWLKEHFKDAYVQKAQQEGFRSRAVYKLEELQRKYRLLRPGMTVVDLGAAPGGWSQLAARELQGKGTIIALDILPMEPLPGVDFVQGDFQDEPVMAQILQKLQDRPVDLVLSDMAPNISGIAAVDQPRAMLLAELALDLADQVLKPDGDLLVKVFQGEGFDGFMRQLKSRFRVVQARKPEASRGRSREVYCLARERKV